MEIVKNLKILKKLEKKFNCKFDRKFRYCVKFGALSQGTTIRSDLHKEGYDLKYFDGCFYPFLVTIN